jgi:hypothetical protein
MNDKEMQAKLEVVKELNTCQACSILADVLAEVIRTRPTEKKIIGFIKEEQEDERADQGRPGNRKKDKP